MPAGGVYGCSWLRRQGQRAAQPLPVVLLPPRLPMLAPSNVSVAAAKVGSTQRGCCAPATAVPASRSGPSSAPAPAMMPILLAVGCSLMNSSTVYRVLAVVSGNDTAAYASIARIRGIAR